MLKIKAIKDKKLAQVTMQSDPCKYAGREGAYDCTYDCKTSGKPRYYKTWKY